MPDPYTPPSASIQSAVSPPPQASLMARIGAWLQLAPVIGLIATTVGMIKAFSTLSTDGVGDPTRLSGAIGEVLIGTAMGFLFGMIGCVLLAIAVFGQRPQPPWVKVLFGISLLPVLAGIIIVTVNLLRTGLTPGS